ncbi:MAG: hypothetical protein AAF802_22965, partial [Planctomycetota bacterium]
TIDGSTGTDVVITADASSNDTLVAGTFITDVAASLAADATSLNDNSRVINFTAVSGDLTLNSLTVTGGRTTGFHERGGGIQFLSAGVVTVAQGAISGNSSSDDGGGISTGTGSVALTGSTVSGNQSGKYGGGIFSISGGVTLTSSTVSGNQSGSEGGGIFTFEGGVTLTGSTVSGNSSSSHGGGISNFKGSVTLASSTVSGNSSNRNGGGIYSDDSTVLITSSTITGNTAGGVGGGVGLLADNYNDNERWWDLLDRSTECFRLAHPQQLRNGK